MIEDREAHSSNYNRGWEEVDKNIYPISMRQRLAFISK